MNPFSATHARASLLVLALAMVGGTGCMTMNAIDHARVQSALRDQETARRQRIAALTPRAQAGDPAARTDLALALLAGHEPAQIDVPRALGLLSQAADQDYVPAQVQLGEILAQNAVSGGVYMSLPPALRDRARGLTLLQRAASHACNVKLDTRTVAPAGRVVDILLSQNRGAETQVWRARSMRDCATPPPASLMYPIALSRASQADRIDAMALLLVVGDAALIADARTKFTPEDAATAERRAADLRREITESERDYPAPPHQTSR